MEAERRPPRSKPRIKRHFPERRLALVTTDGADTISKPEMTTIDARHDDKQTDQHPPRKNEEHRLRVVSPPARNTIDHQPKHENSAFASSVIDLVKSVSPSSPQAFDTVLSFIEDNQNQIAFLPDDVQRDLRFFLIEVSSNEAKRLRDDMNERGQGSLKQLNATIADRMSPINNSIEQLNASLISKMESSSHEIIGSNAFEMLDDVADELNARIPDLTAEELNMMSAARLVLRELKEHGEKNWTAWLRTGRKEARRAHATSEKSVRSAYEKIFTGADIMATGSSPEEVHQFIEQSHSEKESAVYRQIADEYALILDTVTPTEPLVTQYLPALERLLTVRKAYNERQLTSDAVMRDTNKQNSITNHLRDIEQTQYAISRLKEKIAVPYAQLIDDLTLPPPRSITPEAAKPSPTATAYTGGELAWFDNEPTDVNQSPPENKGAGTDPSLERATTTRRSEKRPVSQTIIRKPKTEQNPESLNRAAEQMIHDTYASGFVFDSALQFFNSYRKLRLDIELGTVRNRKQPMTAIERTQAELLLHRMAERLLEHTQDLAKQKANKEKSVTGIRGLLNGVFRFGAKQKDLKTLNQQQQELAAWQQIATIVKK